MLGARALSWVQAAPAAPATLTAQVAPTVQSALASRVALGERAPATPMMWGAQALPGQAAPAAPSGADDRTAGAARSAGAVRFAGTV